MNTLTMSPDYDKHSAIQQKVIIDTIPLILQAIDEINKQDPTRFESSDIPFTIADLGCTSGTNSLIYLTKVIEKVRSFKKEFPILIYLNDLPINDFSKAMINVHQGLKDYTNIWIYSTGSSFTKSLFPANSIDLCVSINSVHWLQKVPALSNQYFFILDEETEKTETGKLWAEEAKTELLMFLRIE
jgi:hypothetical protein